MAPYTDEELEELFDKADISHDGKLMADELVIFLRKQGKKVSTNDVKKYIKKYDDSADGYLQFEEFKHLMNDLFGKE